MTKRVLFVFALFLAALLPAHAQTCGGSSPTWNCTSAQTTPTIVQNTVNAASEGDTINIASGSNSWVTGVTISGKGLHIAGAGSGRIIAYDNGVEELTVGTGTLTMTIAGYSPGFSSASIATGETLRVYETNSRTNFMQGTVTSISGSTLVMNITSTGGSGTTHRWLISTLPSTVITNNSTSAALFSVTEDTSVNTNISGIQFANGTATCSALGCYHILVFWASGGQAVLINNNWFQVAQSEAIEFGVNQGVVWDNSFDGSSGTYTPIIISAVRIKIDPPAFGQQQSWTQPSFWGTLDTTGQNNVYIETCDFHALGAASDNDDNGRMVWRYSLMDNSAWSTHGADTSSYGMRTFEIYNNTAVFNGYSDETTFNLGNGYFYVRGGSFVYHDNVLPALTSMDYGTKPDLAFIQQQLQRIGPNGCWGAGTAAGEDYPAPRQIGMGNVTGNGHAPTGVINLTGGGGSASCGTYTSSCPSNTLTAANTCTQPATSCATAIVSNITTNAISALLRQFNGTGYTSAPSLVISGGLGTGATGSVTESGGSLTGITLGSGGSGYTGETTDSVTYVGDSEPAYIWNNTRTSGGGTVSLTPAIVDYGPSDGQCTGSTYDSTANYVVQNRDYFTTASTAKPSYTPYTYPHPLTSGNPQAGTPTFSPVAGTYSATQTVAISSSPSTVICYNTTGAPATNGGSGCQAGSTLYSGAISVGTTQTLYAVGGGTGYTDSAVGSAAYIIQAAPGGGKMASGTKIASGTTIR